MSNSLDPDQSRHLIGNIIEAVLYNDQLCIQYVGQVNWSVSSVLA